MDNTRQRTEQLPENKKPEFKNNQEEISRKAAISVTTIYKSLIDRKIDKYLAQSFILQCTFAMFAEDSGLLPKDIFTNLVGDCKKGYSSYDLLGALFHHMNSEKQPTGGRFKNVGYFNVGLFNSQETIDLEAEEIELLLKAADRSWSKIHPSIFGAIFESSIDDDQRCAQGTHFTREADIMRIVRPTIIEPFSNEIKKAKTLTNLKTIRKKLGNFKVLDPTCGCGNFLHVAYIELRRLETHLLQKIHDNFGYKSTVEVGISSKITLSQFYGIDINPLAVELAKISLSIAKIQAVNMDSEQPLPLDNLNDNVICHDSLFCNWPIVNAIIGNPPFMGQPKRRSKLGKEYVDKLYSKYEKVPRMSDYCVYFFRKTHDELNEGGRAGLIGTNSIRENHSRIGGLDYIVDNRGTITDAVSSMPWAGKASVHISVVNWIKESRSKKHSCLLEVDEIKTNVEYIESNLKPCVLLNTNCVQKSYNLPNIRNIKSLSVNGSSKICFQGQKTGCNKGFLITPEQAYDFSKYSYCEKVINPYLTGNDLLVNRTSIPSKYSVDLNHCNDIVEAQKYIRAFNHIKKHVYPRILKKAVDEKAHTKKNIGTHQVHLQKWWKYDRVRPSLIKFLSKTDRYIACSLISKKPTFEFIPSKVRPDATLKTIILSDNYSFGILQSKLHLLWIEATGPTLGKGYIYTTSTVFNTFPWPQTPTQKEIETIADAVSILRTYRNKIMTKNNWGLRKLYQTLDIAGKNPLREHHKELDLAVCKAYAFNITKDLTAQLIELNFDLAHQEAEGNAIFGPGCPLTVT